MAPRCRAGLRTTAAPTPAGQATQLALGVVVGRLDVGVVNEAPECIAVFEDVATRTLESLEAQIGAFLEKPLHQPRTLVRRSSAREPGPSRTGATSAAGRGTTGEDCFRSLRDGHAAS